MSRETRQKCNKKLIITLIHGRRNGRKNLERIRESIIYFWILRSSSYLQVHSEFSTISSSVYQSDYFLQLCLETFVRLRNARLPEKGLYL